MPQQEGKSLMEQDSYINLNYLSTKYELITKGKQ